MSAEHSQRLRELEADRKVAQERLFRQFATSPMTVMDYENRSRTIDMKYAREEALIILEAIMQNQ